MAKIRIDEADGLAVRDVVHAKLSTVEGDLGVPVVDDDGHLVGVVAVTGDLASFCGTTAASPA